MRLRLFSVVLAALLAATLGLAPAACAQESAQAESETVKAGRIISYIAQEKGKVVVVNFFASWCAPCLMEIPELIGFREDYTREDVAVLGVSVDQDAEQYEELLTRMDFNYPHYLGAQDVLQVFQVQSIPKTMVYAPDGSLALSHVGYLSGEELREQVEALLRQR